MACGTGKTYITLWIKERLNSKSTLVFVPTLNFLSQTFRAWNVEHTNVKSDAGIRKVPVHPQLIKLGFIEYIAKQKRKNK